MSRFNSYHGLTGKFSVKPFFLVDLMKIALLQSGKGNQFESEKFLTVAETAHRYRTSEQVIYRWITEKRFPANAVLRLGRKILINRRNLQIFENQGGELIKKLS